MTLAYAAVVAGAFGLIFGSFLNVVAYRLPRGESLVVPGLALPVVRDPDQPFDNVPGALVAAAARDAAGLQDVDLGALSDRGGRSRRSCWSRSCSRRARTRDAWLGIAFVLLLVPVTLIDLDHRIIPNKLMLVGAVVAHRARAADAIRTRSPST